jgi:hypothetical protein
MADLTVYPCIHQEIGKRATNCGYDFCTGIWDFYNRTKLPNTRKTWYQYTRSESTRDIMKVVVAYLATKHAVELFEKNGGIALCFE